MVFGIGGGLIINNVNIFEIVFVNMNLVGRLVFFYLCIIIVCGVISGFYVI